MEGEGGSAARPAHQPPPPGSVTHVLAYTPGDATGSRCSSRSGSASKSDAEHGAPDGGDGLKPFAGDLNAEEPDSSSDSSGRLSAESGRAAVHGGRAKPFGATMSRVSTGFAHALPQTEDVWQAGRHLRRIVATGLITAAGIIVLGILPLGLLARQAGDDLIAQAANQTLLRRKSMDFGLKAEPGLDGSIIGFWLVCYLAHALFPSGSLLAAMVAWKGWAALSVTRCAAGVGTFLALFATLLAPRIMYVRRQMHYSTMQDMHYGVYPVWAFGAFLILGVPGGRCIATLLILIFGACYYVCNELIWRVASKELSFETVLVAAFGNNLLRIIMVEVALFVAVRLPGATHAVATTLVALAVALSVTVGHAIAFCADSMFLLLLTQLVHFVMEVSRSFYLLRGQSEGDRALGALRAAHSLAVRCCALASGCCCCCCFRRRSALTPVMPTTDADELPDGLGVGGARAEEFATAGYASLAQRLRWQALADSISLTNIAETAALVALSCLLPLGRVRLGSLEAGHMLPLHQFVLTVLASELATDFTVAVMSSKWSRSSRGAYGYQSTVQVWQGVFSNLATRGCVMCVVALAAMDTACNLVETMCILQEDVNDMTASSLGPCD